MCGQREVSYREAESLNKHILDHSGENPHSCTECKRQFWQTWSISTHLLIHTGEKLHPCGQCDKSFTQYETLNKHLLWNCFFKVCWCEVVLGEVTDEDVEEDIWRWLVFPWSRCWTLGQLKSRSFETLNWLHDLPHDIPRERCHDKPHVRLHDRRHEWPHWQYHDRPKLWYQGSFAILPCLMCLLKTLAQWDEKSHWLHLEFFLFMTYSEKM